MTLNNLITKNENRGKNIKYLPYVFSEEGIAMLAGLLKNYIAVQVSINIIDAFIEMRRFILNNAQVFERLTNVEYKLLEHDDKLNLLFNELQNNNKFKQKIIISIRQS